MTTDNKQVLTDEEIDRMQAAHNAAYHAGGDEPRTFARAVESAVLSKLREADKPAFHGFLDEKAMRIEVCLTPESPRADGEYAIAYYAAPQASAEEKRLRRMLCVQYAGPLAYMDDGEAQDNRCQPFIDFLRDTLDEIERKMSERAAAALKSAKDAGDVDEREAFEAAMVGPLQSLLGVDPSNMKEFCKGEYDSSFVQSAWLAWQARAALPTTEGETMDDRSEEAAEKFIQSAIDRAPEPLRRLGEYLSRVLDEDHWKTAERMLIGACESAALASQKPVEGDAKIEKQLKESLAYLETLANFGGTIQQARELAQKAVSKITGWYKGGETLTKEDYPSLYSSLNNLPQLPENTEFKIPDLKGKFL